MEPDKEEFPGEHRLVRRVLIAVAILLPGLIFFRMFGLFGAFILAEFILSHAVALGAGILGLVLLYVLVRNALDKRKG
ncbi:hypothetical protein [Hymenobacter ruricola]|uniref:SoxR reducing system RseC family protein n=1 Tax=Hymenobacter ruricola TaxID=2791023 RepID=A0ABS0I5H4_9BACT|nr:hypothetical protein [Hymenobacter ruricola]MBF9222221.1 hypothetical protein [Hymenobacter ruricola]